MPAVYAHNFFGIEVKRSLNPGLEKFLNQNMDCFTLGLQGPDYLFFYKPFRKNPVNQLGYQIHNQPVRNFFGQALPAIHKIGPDNPGYAYLLGFICHFMLDKECHPYIESEVEKLSFDHIEMESEFEKFLMVQNGLDPLRYPIYRLIPKSNSTAPYVFPLYEGYGFLSADTTAKAIDSTRLFKRLLHAPFAIKRETLDLLLRLSGHYDSFQGQLLRKKQNPKSLETNPALLWRFQNAVPKTSDLLEEFHKNPESCILTHKQFEQNFV